MIDFITHALSRRFDQLSGQAETLHHIRLLEHKINLLNYHLENNRGQREQFVHQDWIDCLAKKASLQKEWLYNKGVEDGVKLLLFLQREMNEQN